MKLLLAAVALMPCTAWAEPVVVRVAIAAPLSGPRAPMGRAIHAAAALVAADVTAAGSVRVEAVAVEDTCGSSDAQRNAEVLAAAKFDAVIGYPCRATAQAAAPVFGRAGQMLIATAPVVPPFGLAQTGPTVFRLPVAEKSLGQFLGQHLASAAAVTRPDARIAIIRDKTQQAVGLAQAVEAGVRAGGRTVHAVEIFAGGDKAFGPMVQRLKSLAVTHVALLAFPVEGGLIAAELAAARPDIVLVAADFFATPDAPLIAGAAAARLRVVLPSGDPLGAAKGGAAKGGADLLARLKADNIAAGAEALIAASALEAYVDAVRRVGSSDPAAVAAAMRMSVVGARRYGMTRFDSRGHAVVPYWAVFRWGDNGQLIEEQ